YVSGITLMIMASVGSQAPGCVVGWPAATSGAAKAVRMTASPNKRIRAPRRDGWGESNRKPRCAPAGGHFTRVPCWWHGDERVSTLLPPGQRAGTGAAWGRAYPGS